MFLLTGDEELALWLYAIVLFPGVALHELSHALVARLLGVKIGHLERCCPVGRASASSWDLWRSRRRTSCVRASSVPRPWCWAVPP